MKTPFSFSEFGNLDLLPLNLLSSMWLHEPDEGTLARASEELHLPMVTPAELAVAYTDLFLLNVYPYGTVFTDPSGELNGPGAERVGALFERHGYHPPELGEAGAPDHLGLCLGFLALLAGKHEVSRGHFASDFLAWAPVCCLAVEREPSAHVFHRALAARTRETLLDKFSEKQESRTEFSTLVFRDSSPQWPVEDEIRLRDILHFLLAPARCGMFLSRSRLGELGRGLGQRLPFSSRYDVAESLFAAAGQSGQVEALLDRLAEEADAWETSYRAWADAYPAWADLSTQWTGRTQAARRTLNEMRALLSRPLELEEIDA